MHFGKRFPSNMKIKQRDEGLQQAQKRFYLYIGKYHDIAKLNKPSMEDNRYIVTADPRFGLQQGDITNAERFSNEKG
jgi:hypothetical protein